ncbi:MAG: hypothetical protein M3010_00885, partial [Candidatus Dormibacteraeota bacterium]|nr:hypothetical protein [Candidatus Dormibacteraeota bacterium]
MSLKRLTVAVIPATLLLLTSASTTPAAAAPPSREVGSWGAPFEEDPGNATYPVPAGPTEHCTQDPAKGYALCKPAAVNAGVLPDGRVLYWNGLSDLENVQKGVAVEGGGAADSSQARILDLRSSHPVFTTPSPATGAGPEPCDQAQACGASAFPLPGNNGPDPALAPNNHGADHDMFCSDELHLADGRILVSGGTRWYPEPGIPGTPYGQVELQGLRLAQIFDPRSNTFSRVAPMNNGRWYPSLVMKGDGKVFVGGGVRKLIQTDGTNVRQTETFDPNSTSVDPSTAATARPQMITGKWTVNPGGDAALPLFPRFHLLPNGTIYYGGVGQMWGPAGESADEALYGLHQAFDPTTNTWNPFGFGVYGARSGAFSVLLPLHSPYNSARVLIGGGTLGPPPGGYVATNFTELADFSSANNWSPGIADFKAGPPLTQRRWFSSTVTLPNDAVAVFSGANRDEVIDPGNEQPVRTAEWYTPWDRQFHALSDGARDRTYHNTAILL